MANQTINYCNVTSEILKETEKAYYLSVKYYTKRGLAVKEAKIWCPKSCCVCENGNITRVAYYILDRWQKDYYDYLSSKGNFHCEISFNLGALQDTLDKKKTQEDSYKAYCDEIQNRLIEDIKPYADEHLQYAGVFCKELGMYLLNNNKADSGKCNALITLAGTITQEFGESKESNWVKDYFKGNPSKADLLSVLSDCRRILQSFPADRLISKYPQNLLLNHSNRVAYQYLNDVGAKEDRALKPSSNLYKAYKKHLVYNDEFIDKAIDAVNKIND